MKLQRTMESPQQRHEVPAAISSQAGAGPRSGEASKARQANSRPVSVASLVISKASPTHTIPAWAWVLLAAVVVVLVVLVAVLPPRVRDFEKFLSGFWAGDPGFLSQAGLSAMYLYIAPRERADEKRRRRGYLVMVDTAENTVSDQKIEIAWAGLASRWASAVKTHFMANAQETYTIKNTAVAYDDVAVMPESLSLGLNVTEGTLALYNEEKIYAFLIKDNETSLSVAAQFRGADELRG